MIKVKLISHTNAAPLELTSHAALICYQAEAPELGKMIDVENRLFKVGHHTTLQHFFLTFQVEDISVGDITFGLHLTSPFYNSDQRSGRYCAKMFVEPDFEKIENYIESFWPDLEQSLKNKTLNYIKKGVNLYQENIATATELAAKFIREERPFANDKYIEMSAPKIAQEQVRSFIPVIFPTAFDLTINLTALVAMYEAAWNPVMRDVTGKMAQAAVEKFPELAFVFREDARRQDDWAPKIKEGSQILSEPRLKILEISRRENFRAAEEALMAPVDKLHFTPELMDNSFDEIKTEIEISVATMGQDQRHRTIRRSTPEFTGNFYLPPILAALGLEEAARGLLEDWKSLSQKLPDTLAAVIAPYGAMVRYKKAGSLNAVAHEQAKRLCWCAQEEIYHLSRLLRLEIEKLPEHSPLLKLLEPPCYSTGLCAEGARYCGRDIKLRTGGDYFPKRKI